MKTFMPANILLPNVDSMEKWAVIAVDQFVSQPEYWDSVRKTVGDTPSTLHLVLPEADLGGDSAKQIACINQTMERYLESDLFRCYAQSFIYVERTLLNGTIRKGIVGAVDLEDYNYSPDSQSAVRATEKTVVERIPPRMDIRRDAPIELPHVLLLCDDESHTLIDSVSEKKNTLPKLYDFDLMEGGGRIEGWLVAGADADAFCQELDLYQARINEKFKDTTPVLFAVGDGNHSLASAKGCYEELKAGGADVSAHPARYALVELENIHDDAQVFEPIHRIIKETQPKALLKALEETSCAQGGSPVRWYCGEESGVVYLNVKNGQLPVGVLQSFLDEYLHSHAGETDYIHGDDTLRQLSRAENSIGFLLPPMEKSSLFGGIIADGVLPRKTFSMGHAQEKRYYLEARIIK